VAAARPDLPPVQAAVLARAEQGQEPEQAAALLDPEAVDQLEAALEAAEAALGEADHKLAQQNSRSSRCAPISFAKHFTSGTTWSWPNRVQCRTSNTGIRESRLNFQV
jgi:hypothetical protein